MSKNIIKLKELGLPLIDLNKSPEEIKEDIISYILKTDELPFLVNLRAQTRHYLLEQPIDKYLDINDVLFLLRKTTTNHYTNEIIERYFFNEKSADAIISEYNNNHRRFEHADAHKGIVMKLYSQFKEISDEEFIKRRNTFYEKYQPIKLFGKICNQTNSLEYPNDLKNIPDIRRIYHGAWFLLKAFFTFYNDNPECIETFFDKPIGYNYGFPQKWTRTRLNYSLDNITEILTGLRLTHNTFRMDEFLLRTFKILDSRKNLNEVKDIDNISEDLFIPFPAAQVNNAACGK